MTENFKEKSVKVLADTLTSISQILDSAEKKTLDAAEYIKNEGSDNLNKAMESIDEIKVTAYEKISSLLKEIFGEKDK